MIGMTRATLAANFNKGEKRKQNEKFYSCIRLNSNFL